jgi:competence protein ComEA
MFELPHFTESQRRVIYFALALAVALGALFFSLARGNAAPATSKPNATGGITVLPSYSPTPEIPATIVVDVAGKVLHAGIYTLPQGSRAADAIKAAGNALRGVSLTDINLAQVLTDGQQIIVGAPAITSVSKNKSKSGAASSGKITTGTININTATLAQCEQLPGVGAVMAARIVAYRTAHGNFTTITDLSKVSGMGKSKFANLKSFVRV